MPAGAIITVCLNPAIDRVFEVEDFAIGAHQAGRQLSLVPAGKAINVSRVLAALGVRSIATGFLGKDNRSLFDPVFRSGLIADEFFQLPGRTRENVTIADKATGVETHIRDAGLHVERFFLERLARKLRLLSRPESIVIFSGSLPPGISPPDLVDLIAQCAASGAKVAVDTSGEALQAMAGRRLWLVKPNAAELAELAGRELAGPAEQLQAARGLAADIDVVLFTRGAEGAWLFTPQLALHGQVGVQAEQVRNTVGCGDALLGAFVAAVHQGKPLHQAFADALACASASACTFETADFHRATFEDFKTKVQLTELPQTASALRNP